MIKNLLMLGDKTRPEVNFDYEKAELSISGRSILEYAEIVFEPMTEWLEKYLESPKEETTINLQLEYFNSSTSKALVRFLVLAKKLLAKNLKLKVNFYYDDENIYEYGQDFMEVVGIPFNMIEKNFHL